MRKLNELNSRCENYCKKIVGSTLSLGAVREKFLWDCISKRAEKEGFKPWNTHCMRLQMETALVGKTEAYKAEFFLQLTQVSISVNCVCHQVNSQGTTYLGEFNIPITIELMVRKAGD